MICVVMYFPFMADFFVKFNVNGVCLFFIRSQVGQWFYQFRYRFRIVYDERQCRSDFNAMSSMSGDMNNAGYAASLICFLPTDKHAKMICVVMYFPFIK
jgi:hypothetical protein